MFATREAANYFYRNRKAVKIGFFPRNHHHQSQFSYLKNLAAAPLTMPWPGLAVDVKVPGGARRKLRSTWRLRL
jgi:hypothetical protein